MQMKRSIIIFATLILAQTLSAQIITSRSVVQEKKVTAQYPLKKGYRGFAEASMSINAGGGNKLGFNISTIHGYQFNHWLYAGGGVGFEGTSGLGFESYNSEIEKGVMLMTVPVFVDIRTYFTRTKFKPFLELQLGYKIACGSKEDTVYYSEESYYRHTYKSGKLHMSLGLGVEYKRLSLKLSYSLLPYKITMTDYFMVDGHIYVYGYNQTPKTSLVCIGLGVNF